MNTNLWVILCGTEEGPGGDLPDVYGPFNSEAEATDWLKGGNSHGVAGWAEETPLNQLQWAECYGGVTPQYHAIVQVFK
jgi:hypothetical protein